MFRRSQKEESADVASLPTESEGIDTSMAEYECNDISDSVRGRGKGAGAHVGDDVNGTFGSGGRADYQSNSADSDQCHA